MLKRWMSLAAVLAAVTWAPRSAVAQVADSTSGVTRSVRSLGVTIGEPPPLATFRPAVPPFGENGRCRTLPEEGGGRLVLLSFENGPGGASRTVSLELDVSGTARRYSDARGDLEENGTGPLTSVSAELPNGQASAVNTNAGAPSFAIGNTHDALDMANLGTPRAMIERIKRECGTGAK